MNTSSSLIRIPELSLVVLIGASGSGKSTFAHRHFLPTEIISSDFCRGLVSDDENNQSASKDAFEVLHYIAAKRLAAGRLTVVDATNVRQEDRKSLISLARQFHCIPVAIVLNLSEEVCHQRNQQRPNRQFGSHVVRRHVQSLRRSLKSLKREGFRQIEVLSSVDDIEAVSIERQPLWNNRKSERGPFDIIGDVHGCCDELQALLTSLGYQEDANFGEGSPFWTFSTYRHPQGRRVIFLGDLVDRGPRILDVLKLVRNMVKTGSALCVPGNHDMKLLRKLNGKDAKINHGLEQTLAEIEALPEDMQAEATSEICQFLDGLVSHFVLDGGKLVVAHAGMKAELQGRGSAQVRDFALYGETTGEIDEFGLPVRYNWAAEYRGEAMVVYGHTPIPAPEWLNKTVNIDTGCVFGGTLTALNYPEGSWVSVPAQRVYCQPVKPLGAPLVSAGDPGLTAQQEQDDVLDMADVLGKRVIDTRLMQKVTLREDKAQAALEVISRFAIHPKWLIYLPPTMSPVATSYEPDWLEHPTQAFDYYEKVGVGSLLCEEKHMGSRAVVIVCRDEAVAQGRFGIQDQGLGICYTRTGRRFFADLALERAFLDRVRQALSQSQFWQRWQTDWVCLDCELMPWSVKAQGLLQQQYAAVGSSAQHGLQATLDSLQQAALRGVDVGSLLDVYHKRSEGAARYVQAYRRYCWPVISLSDLKLAPFHVLATEGSVHTHQPHTWHLSEIAQVCAQDPDLLLATQHYQVDLSDAASRAAATAWWQALTEQGGEGMVVKPLDFVVQTSQGLVQPAVKCRGREYLRIIYGPEYDLHLDQLRQRGLSLKRSLALREFALGIEALERFVARDPLRRVHECVFGILALESEGVDPRL